MAGSPLSDLTHTDSDLARLREFGEIETWWDGDAGLPDDASPSRRVVRGMLDAMLQRDRVGDKTTRVDNLWRGLPAEHTETAQQAVMVLNELGFLALVATPGGMRASVHPDALDTIKDVVARGNAPDALAALWAE
jgi:hypothetical protein